MNTASRQGLGFEYEDKIRTSAVIHMYSNMHFLDLDNHITSITLGGAKFGYKTDDIILETSFKKYCVQVKKTITGVADESFNDFIVNAYHDFLKDQNSYYCLITETISKDFFVTLKSLISNANGVINSDEFNNIIVTKKEKSLKSYLIKKLNIEDILLFLKQLKIFQINSLESFNKDKIILNQYKVTDLNLAYNMFFLKVKELKENNQTIDHNNFHNFFNFLNYNKKTTINEEWKNKISDYVYSVNQLIKNSSSYEDYHNFSIITKSILGKLKNEDKTILNNSIYRSIKILEIIMKYSLAVASDLMVLEKLLSKPCPDITRLNIIYNDVNSEIVNNLTIKECIFNIIKEDIEHIQNHYEFIATRKIYKFKLEKNTLNLLISKSSNLYSEKMFNYKYYTIELMNLLILTASGVNVIDTINYIQNLDYLSDENYKIFMNVFDKDSINITLEIINYAQLYENAEIKQLMKMIRSINLIFIIFMQCCNQQQNLEIHNKIIGKLHFLGDQFNKIYSENKQKLFLQYLDFCQVNGISNDDIFYIPNMLSFLKLMNNHNIEFDEKKIISLIFTKEREKNDWYQKNEDLLNNFSSTRFYSFVNYALNKGKK